MDAPDARDAIVDCSISLDSDGADIITTENQELASRCSRQESFERSTGLPCKERSSAIHTQCQMLVSRHTLESSSVMVESRLLLEIGTHMNVYCILLLTKLLDYRTLMQNGCFRGCPRAEVSYVTILGSLVLTYAPVDLSTISHSDLPAHSLLASTHHANLSLRRS